MRAFIGSESFFFIGLLFSHLYLKTFNQFSIHAPEYLHIKTTGIFTLFLIASSFTYMLCEKSFRKQNQTGLKIWLGATILLGCVFLFGQGKEYYSLIQESITIQRDPFGTSFYTVTGFHVLHVIIGLITLAILLILAFLGDFKNTKLQTLTTVGYYWHFVDVVWIAVFTVIYIIPLL